MIPLYIFLIAWLVFLGFYAIMSAITVMQMTRFGIVGSGTWLATLTFLTVAFVVLLACSWYFLTVDWQQPINLFAWFSTTTILPTF